MIISSFKDILLCFLYIPVIAYFLSSFLPRW